MKSFTPAVGTCAERIHSWLCAFRVIAAAPVRFTSNAAHSGRIIIPWEPAGRAFQWAMAVSSVGVADDPTTDILNWVGSSAGRLAVRSYGPPPMFDGNP